MKSAVGGLLAVLILLPVLSAASSSTTATTAQAAAAQGGGALNTTLVPPEYLAAVMQAGAMCPEESAPLIAAQIEAESNWDPTAVSPAGAEGIAQFMPGTWATWGQDWDGSGTISAFEPGDAIPSQGAFMCELFRQVKSAMDSGTITRGTLEQNALAAYNCGLGNVLASGGFPTGITETDAYVPRIQTLKAKYTIFAAGGGPGGAAAVAAALRYLGYPYVWGAGDINGPTGYLWSEGPPIGFDCEGLTHYAIWQGYHVDIGYGTRGQLATPALVTVTTRAAGAPQPLDVMLPGDVVVLNLHPSPDGPWGHVALYIGNGQFVHAPQTGDVVKITSTDSFARADWTVRRVPAQSGPTP